MSATIGCAGQRVLFSFLRDGDRSFRGAQRNWHHPAKRERCGWRGLDGGRARSPLCLGLATRNIDLHCKSVLSDAV
eukprot:1775587-Pleurochrysis_carterae.AAC.6